MVFLTKSRFLFECFALILLGLEVSADNYPSKNAFKPCAMLQASVQIVLPLCVPDGPDTWKQETVDNCGILKASCPEFNKAKCVWLDYEAAKCGPSTPKPLKFPCCHLSYKAKGYTWMEIFYTNQYGTSYRNDTAFDIVELHRKIKDKSSFGKFEQPDWPENVQNPQGERGLTWMDVDFEKIKHPPLTASIPICGPNKNSTQLCSNEAMEIVKTLFRPDKGPIKTFSIRNYQGEEDKYKYGFRGSCSSALIGGVRNMEVCKVTFTQGFNDIELKRPYLEVQVYLAKPPEPDSKNFTFSMRYAQLIRGRIEH